MTRRLCLERSMVKQSRATDPPTTGARPTALVGRLYEPPGEE
jgi:hypothetical protein